MHLKSQPGVKEKRKRYTPVQVSFLREMYDQHIVSGGGKVTQQRQAHTEMKRQFCKLSGPFSKQLVLGQEQIASYFSRLKAKAKAAADRATRANIEEQPLLMLDGMNGEDPVRSASGGGDVGLLNSKSTTRSINDEEKKKAAASTGKSICSACGQLKLGHICSNPCAAGCGRPLTKTHRCPKRPRLT